MLSTVLIIFPMKFYSLKYQAERAKLSSQSLQLKSFKDSFMMDWSSGTNYLILFVLVYAYRKDWLSMLGKTIALYH